MFEIGFSEIMVIGIVAVIMLGPEKLPKVARTCGALYGSFQRYFSVLKEEMEQDLALENLRKVTNDAKSQMTDIQAHLADVHADLSGMPHINIPPLASFDQDKSR